MHAVVIKFGFLFSFYFYIYPPDSQESDGGVIHRAGNYPGLISEMPRYCCPVETFYCGYQFYRDTMRLKCRTACQDHQAEESAVKCLSQAHSRMARVGFEPRPSRSQSQRSNHSTTLLTIIAATSNKILIFILHIFDKRGIIKLKIYLHFLSKKAT